MDSTVFTGWIKLFFKKETEKWNYLIPFKLFNIFYIKYIIILLFNIFSQTALQQDNGNQYALIHKCQSQATHARTEDHS